jgi:hypothetical protein
MLGGDRLKEINSLAVLSMSNRVAHRYGYAVDNAGSVVSAKPRLGQAAEPKFTGRD